MRARHEISRLVVFVIALAALVVPAILQGEILYLKDGSELKGKVVSFEGDTLVFAPNFGGRITVHRRDILKLVLDESGAAEPTPAGKPAKLEGPGTISVVFKQDKLNSKIAVTKKTKSIESEIERANWIQQLLIVDSDTVFARIDTTTDKKIYKGHEKELKNTMRLEDMKVTVDAGVHQCIVVVRNLGMKEYADEFREGPLDMVLEFSTVGVYTNQTTTLQVGIAKGFMKMGSPKFVDVAK
jgi:hypothetical protein